MKLSRKFQVLGYLGIFSLLTLAPMTPKSSDAMIVSFGANPQGAVFYPGVIAAMGGGAILAAEWDCAEVDCEFMDYAGWLLLIAGVILDDEIPDHLSLTQEQITPEVLKAYLYSDEVAETISREVRMMQTAFPEDAGYGLVRNLPEDGSKAVQIPWQVFAQKEGKCDSQCEREIRDAKIQMAAELHRLWEEDFNAYRLEAGEGGWVSLSPETTLFLIRKAAISTPFSAEEVSNHINLQLE